MIASVGDTLAGQVTCASTGGKYVECPLPGSGDIVMKQQLSTSACVKDKTWGETADGVYVKGGCRAIFETMSMNQPQNTAGGGNGYKDLIGAKAAGGESDLQRRGYTFVRTTTQANSKLGYWWKPNRAGCISGLPVSRIQRRSAGSTTTLCTETSPAARSTESIWLVAWSG